jgi:hypothetical protein
MMHCSYSIGKKLFPKIIVASTAKLVAHLSLCLQGLQPVDGGKA